MRRQDRRRRIGRQRYIISRILASDYNCRSCRIQTIGSSPSGGSVSPILVRPVREQLEHDRVIRLLLVRLKRKGDIVANIGDSQTVPVRVGQVQIFPDLVLTSTDRTHKLLGTVEVETAESVNHLEAMSQWAHLGRVRAPFHLYVPVGSVEIARRLAAENNVNVAEMWSFHTIGDQTRFTLVHRSTPE